MTKTCINIHLPASKFNGIMLVGEAPGATEEQEGKPFVGRSGKLLMNLMSKAGLKRNQSIITNVFHIRPPDNQIVEFFIRPSIAREQGIKYSTKYPEFEGQFVYHPYDKQLRRLRREIREHKPAIILAVGRVSLWALTGESKIGENVGKFLPCSLCKTQAVVLPIYHPSYLARVQVTTPILISDTVKILKTARKRAKKLLQVHRESP